MEQKKQSNPQIKLHNSVRELSLQLYRTLLLCGVACVVMVMATSSIMTESRLGLGIIGVICVIVVGLILYANTWSYGDRDANFVQFGRMTRDRLKGLKIGLLISIPSFLMNIPLALSKMEIIPFDFMPIYRLLLSPLWPLINFIHPYGAIPYDASPATEYTEAMAATPGLGWGQFGLLVLLPLIYTLFSWIGYELGYHRISVGFRLVYEDKNKKKK